MTETLKSHLERRRLQSSIVAVGGNYFRPKEPPGEGNSYYAAAGTPLAEVARLAVNLQIMGPELLEYALDPITDPTIRSYYERIGARTEDIARYLHAQ